MIKIETEIIINNISIKARSKKEIYMVLSLEGGIYLPPILDANSKYIKDIMTDSKKYLYWKNINTIKVPHIKSLEIKNIITFARQHCQVDNYLPVYSKLPNREWLCNIINILIPNQFIKLIDEAMKNREKWLVDKLNLKVNTTHDIISIFNAFKNVSYIKGRTYFLMRKTNESRKKKFADIEMDQNEEEYKEAGLLWNKIKSLENKIKEYQANQDLLLQDMRN